jgi:hypothetical protein
MATTTTDRLTRCRYRRRNEEMCTGEAVDDLGEILLCPKHLARAIELVNARLAAARRNTP